MLLLEDGHGGVVEVQPRLWDRISYTVHSDQIDRDLADGASPDSTVELSLRAEALTSTAGRQVLADALGRLAAAAEAATPVRHGLPVSRQRVLEALGEVRELIRRLLAPGPVSVRGVAQAKVLLTTGWAPLRGDRDADSLVQVLERAIAGLDA
jgi:hypothetical protein